MCAVEPNEIEKAVIDSVVPGNVKLDQSGKGWKKIPKNIGRDSAPQKFEDFQGLQNIEDKIEIFNVIYIY